MAMKVTDTLNGGLGDDQMFGGVGNDIYIVEQVGDSVNELLGAGTDTVRASIDYVLAMNNNVENLTLLPGMAISATGNELNNVITGNANANTLIGGAGSDTLDGGSGHRSNDWWSRQRYFLCRSVRRLR